MHTIRALEEIANSKGYDIALMTTFNLDVDFFERYIAGTLYSNGVKKIALFVDAKELNKAINSTWKKSLLMGSHYSVNPVRMSGAFHPKVLLLLGEDKAKLIVASANCTQSGYSTNNEVFDVFEIESGRMDNLNLIKAAVDFFKRIYEMPFTYSLDDEIMDDVIEIPYLMSGIADTDGDCYLIHSLEKPIIEQVKELAGTVTSIDIAVPFYDNELIALSHLVKELEASSVNTYVQNRRSRFNVTKAKGARFVNVFPFDGFLEPRSSSFYHGKVLRFETDNACWVLYGSANCTAAALLSTAMDNGNVECCILEKGAKNEYDYFFDNMILDESESEVVCDLLDYSYSQEPGKYYYKYGMALEGTIEFHIGIVGEYDDAIFMFNGIELNSKYNSENKTIIAKISEDLIPNDSDIITLKISGKKNEEEIKCWITRPTLIQFHREQDNSNRSFKFNPEAIGDEYYEDIMKIMSVLAVYTEDKIKKKEAIRIVEQAKNNEEDYEDAPEGIIDYVIPPREPTMEEYREYQTIKKAQKIGCDFVIGYISRRKNGDIERKKQEVKRPSGASRQPTPVEQRIKRYIRNAVAAMQNEDNIKENTVEDYINHASIIMHVMSVLTDNVAQGMFDLNLNAEIRMDLLKGLVKLDGDFTDVHIKATLQMVLEIHYINQRRCKNISSYDDTSIAEVLLALNKRIHIRERLELYITDETAEVIGDHLEELFFKEENMGKVSGVRPSRVELLQYLNKVFGYKTKDQLYDILYKNFGEGCTIVDGDTFTVIARVKLKEYFSGNNIEWIMNEIEKFCKSYDLPSRSIAIDLEGVNIPDTTNPAVRLLYKRKIGKIAIDRYEYHKHGEPYYEKLVGDFMY